MYTNAMTEEAKANLEFYLERFAKDVHCTAKEHGWWEEERGGAECIALMHSELSEALEAQRETEVHAFKDGDKIMARPSDKHLPHLPNEAVELADCIIRILDYAVHVRLPVVQALIEKAEFNKGREYKHGKEF